MNRAKPLPLRRRNAAHAFTWCVVVALPILAGCNSNLDQVLYISANAAASTAVDGWLTTLANAIAASFEG